MIEIKEDIKSAFIEALDERKSASERSFVYGLKGLAKLLGVSYSTAYRIHSSKILSKATYQVKRTVMFDADQVLNILCAANKKTAYPSFKRR